MQLPEALIVLEILPCQVQVAKSIEIGREECRTVLLAQGRQGHGISPRIPGIVGLTDPDRIGVLSPGIMVYSLVCQYWFF